MPVNRVRVDVAELVFLREAEVLLHLRLDRAEICIGSHPTNDVVVPDPTLPDVAALLIDRGAHRFRLRDLSNGLLRVNDAVRDEDEIEIGSGDVIRIGDFTLRLQIRADDGFARQRESHTTVLGEQPRDGARAVVKYQGEEETIDPARPFNIGGHVDNDLVVRDPYVSSFHCRITNREGRWFLVDLESTNGTEVNGLKVREAELPSPAALRLGKAVLTFEVAGGAEGASAARSPGEPFHGMIAASPAMQWVFDQIKKLADTREPVLIVGESGSGKELVARALHDQSARQRGPYLALNCGALSANLIEGELFGHVKGAFTGALSDKEGAFEAAQGGTLFLDEIGELPLELQPKLLRVLETSTIRRVGGTKEIPVNTRIVAATHRNLEELVAEGNFREDLFHRLFVLSIRIPRLGDRPEDVIPLARHFLASQAPRPLGLGLDAEHALLEYSWPGNVRELRNIMVRAIINATGPEIRASDLQFSRDAFDNRAKDARRSVRRHDEQEREKILDALERANGNRAEAARLLGVSKSTFHDRLKRYGIPLKFGDRRGQG